MKYIEEFILNEVKDKHQMDFMKTPLSDFEENWVGYDVNSLMHYGEDAFTKNGKKTITFKDPEITLNTGQRLRPTTKGQFFMRLMIFKVLTCLTD